MNLHLQALLLIVFVLYQPAFAQTLPKPKTKPTSSTTSIASNPLTPTAVDQLQEKLRLTHRSKTAVQIKKAYAALQEEEFNTAIQLISKVKTNETFGDYYYWISAAAYRGLAGEHLEEKNFKAAQQAADKASHLVLSIESTYPYSPFMTSTQKELAQADLLQAEAYLGTKQWKKAQQNFERAFQRIQSQNLISLLKPPTLNHYAETCKKSQGALCTSWLQKFTLTYGKKTEEIKAISEFFPDIVEQTKAFRPPAKLTAPYKSPDADYTSFDTAMKMYFEEKYSDAAKGLRQFLDDYPRSAHRFKARYWLAQTLMREKEQDKAQKLYADLHQDSPYTYYGLLAAQSIGKPFDEAVSTTMPLATDSDPLLSPLEQVHLNRAKYFLAESAPALAGLELKDIKARDGLTTPFLVYLANLHSMARSYRICFQILGELIQRGQKEIFSTFGLKMIFPIEYMEIIKKHASLNEIDPILVLSLIKQESAFTEDAGSSSGAMGLMQIMPMTALEVDPKIQIADLVSVEENIRIGTRYLKKLLSKFNGNIVLALAGYNAGPNAADRWIKEASSKKSMIEFIEGIPYRETREYVSAIIRNYYWYCRLLKNDVPKELDYFWKSYGPSAPPPIQGPAPASVPMEPPADPGPLDSDSKPQNGSA